MAVERPGENALDMSLGQCGATGAERGLGRDTRQDTRQPSY